MDEYSSTRTLNRTIRKVENRFATNLAKSKWQRRQLENDLEWFVTWKIKQVTKPDTFWCDGATDLHLERLSKKLLQIKALIRIGPESNVNCISEAILQGTILLSSHGKRLKAYKLVIEEGESKYVLSKKT